MYFLPNLRQAKLNKGMTQKQVCEILEMKQSQYSRYESGEDEMKIGTLIEICKVLKTSSDYILGLSNEPTPIYKSKNITNINQSQFNGNVNINQN